MRILSDCEFDAVSGGDFQPTIAEAPIDATAPALQGDLPAISWTGRDGTTSLPSGANASSNFAYARRAQIYVFVPWPT